MIDTTNKDWREEIRSEILGGEYSVPGESDKVEEQKDNEDEITDDEVVMMKNQALQAAEDIAKFALRHGDEDLANYMSPAVHRLRELELCRLKQSINS